ncbi:hypothetical protein [Flavobacterium suncheonense]|uniref:GLPGLI family protein n=1 Tax=Flavobacterium suncheonense GH29-5 = DSM 17707 TaxID=1121899 RepID=A0A0A2MBL7_9FLAO|nr:hypothetical protein [Flavobacterium suncheonense]KGO85645.1 hypothetical protein Q764_14020 [Flavobacterium suncheonense GH29-5 = DSM 17707]
MKTKLTFIILLIYCPFFCFGQKIYTSKYKLLSLTEKSTGDFKSQTESLFFENMIYNFESNEKIGYLKNTETLNDPSVQSNVSGDENIYVNYPNNIVCYKLDKSDIYTYKNIKFKKYKNSNVVVLGFKTTKYISEDGNIIIYTTKNLPWFVQPCLVNSNQFNESIVKFENRKSKYGFELIEYKIKEKDTDFENISKVLEKKNPKFKKTIICPFFK